MGGVLGADTVSEDEVEGTLNQSLVAAAADQTQDRHLGVIRLLGKYGDGWVSKRACEWLVGPV